MSLPESWTEARLDGVCQLNPKLESDEQPDVDTKVTFIPMAAVDENIGVISKPEIRRYREVAKGYTSFKEHDVLFAKVTPCMENGKAAIVGPLVNGFGFGSTEFHVLRPTDLVLSEYLFHFIREPVFRLRAKSAFIGTGGLQRVPPNFLARVKLPLPTLPEQQRIVDVLKQGEAVSQVNEHFDELLVRIKQQLFVEMFGDPNPKGNTAWPIIKLGSAVTIATGGTPPRDQPSNYGGDVAWVKSTDLIDALISRTDECVTDLGIKRSNATVYPKDTVMLAMYGQGQTRGRTGKLLIDAACNQACAALLPSDELVPDYIWVWLQLSYEAVRFLGRGGQQENLNLKIIRDIKIPKPPVSLQLEFSRRLNQLLEIDKSTSAARKKLETLLVSVRIAALTGEITSLWREQYLDEVIEAAKTRDDKLRKRGTKVIKHAVQASKFVTLNNVFLPARHWLIDELGAFQQRVLQAFINFPNQPFLAEDPIRFSEFCDDDILVEQLADFSYSPNHIRRTLGQLASLGLISKISVPKTNSLTLEIEYLKAFRPLREEEDSRLADSATLRRSLSDTKSSMIYQIYAILDYETSERAGAGGMFQVSSLTDDVGRDRSSLVDQGRHYESEYDLRIDIAKGLQVNVNQIELIGL